MKDGKIFSISPIFFSFLRCFSIFCTVFSNFSISCFHKVKLMGNVEYEGKDIVVGPARVRQKRSSLFKTRPDQLWQSVVPGVQQPVYYSVAQDGAWYFQPSTPQVISVVPTQTSYPQANCWPSTQYQMQATYPQTQVQYATNPVSTPVVSAVGEFMHEIFA